MSYIIKIARIPLYDLSMRMLLRSYKREYGLLEVKADFGFGLVELALIAVKVMRGINPD
ncbi:hypothetical protein ACWGXJ_23780 [Paenibacillus sp. S33]|uniref:hypothetical protein n=1 Tax=Paenibacillus TaxID=44249 RepID=UPI000AE3774A|nr:MULTISPECIES: hypothetical protein [Paenibacillus]MCP3777847.1 hypothetical protein [Paenibacillus sp. MZ03-122A]KAF6579222.1 hypothetical protein G9G54_10900 [Paenibacillus sp. EKM212P]MCP3806852.1 hypothetical protein [Paenibacillus sp. Lou8.1]MXO76529.1 hypothetical protein [Paenibacillus sp. OT2-17]URJ39377.1 hypothetical protein MF627_003903 [Paenibacillus polymyxa]